jgi:hypothetical protein
VGSQENCPVKLYLTLGSTMWNICIHMSNVKRTVDPPRWSIEQLRFPNQNTKRTDCMNVFSTAVIHNILTAPT